MEAMVIYGTEIQVKEWKGKRVVTFKDIDTVHQRPDGTASRNFRANRQRFISGVDFFKINQPDEIRRLGVTRPQGGLPDEVTLITESGYLMLVKSFTDDLAWKVQRELVDTYFRVKEIAQEADAVIDTGKLIKCAEIMAGCLEGNRLYVLNILRNIIPNIDDVEVQNVKAGADGDAPDMTEKAVVRKRIPSKEGYSEPFNTNQFKQCLDEADISNSEFERLIGCSEGLVSRWLNGTRPSKYYRTKICIVLNLPEGYFDNDKPARRRRRSSYQ